MRLGAFRLGRGGLFLVDEPRAGEHQCERSLGGALRDEEHPPDIGMLDDRHRGLRRILLRGEASLLPRASVLERVAIGGVAHRRRGAPHPDARLVHHMEHVGEAVVRLADEFTEAGAALAEVEEGRGRPAPPHLMDEAPEDDLVGCAEHPVVRVATLRDDEEGDPLGAGRRAGDPGEDQVHDVLGELVLAGGDPDLRPLDAVGAVGVRVRGGAEIGEGGAGVGFGERHRPAEASIEHRGEPLRLLGLRTEGRDEVRGAGGEHRIARAPDVRRFEPGDRRPGDRMWELQAAALGIVRGGDDPRLGRGRVRGLELRLRDDHAVDDLGLLLVVPLSVRRVVALRDLARRLEHGVVDLPILLGEARARGQRLDVEEFVEEEVEIAGIQEFAHRHLRR